MRYLGTRELPTDTLTPLPDNPRRGDVERIRESLRRNGQYRPIVARDHGDGTLTVLAGNHTWQAARAERMATIRGDVIECDDAEAARVAAWDNRGDDLALDDDHALLDLLDALGGDLDGTGHDRDDLDDLRAIVEEQTTTGLPGENADHFGHYAPATSRVLLLDYPIDVYRWVEGHLATIRQERGMDSNAAAVAHVVAAVTGHHATGDAR